MYALEMSLQNQTELLAYHWHPNAPGEITIPHLHLSAAAQVRYAPLVKAHLPTGFVALQDVLRLAVDDLGVRPLRADWRTVLDETQAELQRG
jgi:hypothetical protein